MSPAADPIARDVVPGERLWVVVVVTRPRRDPDALRELTRTLAHLGARRMSTGVFLVRDAAGLHDRLVVLAERVRAGGGQLILADSRIVDREPAGDDRAR